MNDKNFEISSTAIGRKETIGSIVLLAVSLLFFPSLLWAAPQGPIPQPKDKLHLPVRLKMETSGTTKIHNTFTLKVKVSAMRQIKDLHLSLIPDPMLKTTDPTRRDIGSLDDGASVEFSWTITPARAGQFPVALHLTGSVLGRTMVSIHSIEINSLNERGEHVGQNKSNGGTNQTQLYQSLPGRTMIHNGKK